MSCLFNSLSHFLHISSFDIRQQICDYLEQNKPIIDGLDTNYILSFEDSSASSYIQNMRRTSTWGGGIEIQAACNLWNLRIIVHNYRNRGNKNIEFIPVTNSYDRTIEIYWTGGHYEPLS